MRNSTEISWEATKERLSEAEHSLKNAGHELAAYKKAKAENDERFQIAAAVAERERDEARAGQNAHEVNCAKIERKMWRGKAAIKRIRALMGELYEALDEE